jgi:pimeloyl-ACP methyl ester carboxylesterase
MYSDALIAEPAGRAGRWAGLAGTEYGDPDAGGRPFLLLHGLTFDRRMWQPIAAALPRGHRALALDLPGHGDSPSLERHHIEEVAGAVYEAVLEAGMEAPILVGHSIAGLVATMYAGMFPAAAVVNVDGHMSPPEPYLRSAQTVAAWLHGERFRRAWGVYRNSMRIDRVPEPYRPLLAAAYDATPERVLSYWAELLQGDPDQRLAWVSEQTDVMMGRVRRGLVPYVGLVGDSVDASDRAWFEERLPHARLVAWPVGHHFPHLADPERFVALLTGLAAGLPAR